MSARADAIVIGAGINGLATAALLAQAGRSVLVLERAKRPGGIAAREPFHGDHGELHFPGLPIRMGRIHPALGPLDLQRHGLRLDPNDPGVFAPQRSGRGLWLQRDPDRAAAEIAHHAPRDAAAYREWRAFLDSITGVVRAVLEEPAPSVHSRSLLDLLPLARTGLSARRLGKHTLFELMRIGPMCAADWLNDAFESSLLKTLIAGGGLQASFLGPWSSGSAATVMLQECEAGPSIAGGPAALVDALLRCGESLGVKIRTEAEVSSIDVRGARVEGVGTIGGERIEAPIVAAACDPRRALLSLLPSGALPLETEQELRSFRQRGTTAVLALALKQPLRYSCRPEQTFAHARLSEELDDLERAFDPVKYRRFPSRPMLDVHQQSPADSSLGKGGAVALVLVHFVPRDLEGGWSQSQRSALEQTVLDTLSQYAAEMDLLGSKLFTPLDLEERYGLSGGHLFHGEAALDQLASLRPASSCARYATPIEGLFLCGKGSHPGPFVTCGAGALAARAILSSRRGLRGLLRPRSAT